MSECRLSALADFILRPRFDNRTEKVGSGCASSSAWPPHYRTLRTRNLKPKGGVRDRGVLSYVAGSSLSVLAKSSTTFSNGCLGSHNDEERSEMRYVMRIAGPRESSNF